MNLLWICQGFGESHALGALVRRRGFESAFRSDGVNVISVTLRRKVFSVLELLSVSGKKTSDGSMLRDEIPSCDVVVIEGLATAVACIRRLRVIFSGPIHVDVCDSWIQLSGVGLGSGSTVRALAIRRLKVLAAKVALKFVSNFADSISYISKRDLAADNDYISPAVVSFVIPNGAPVARFSSNEKWDPAGPMVVVGDWGYPPNRQMLRETVRWYMQCLAQKDMPGLNIIGPNLVDDIPVHESINVFGWIEDITSAYSGVSAALAFVSSGAGVKNKVLEPLSFGIPIIATKEAMNGIDVDHSMVLEYRENLSASEVDDWLARVSRHGARAIIAPSWEQNLKPLLSHLERRK